VSLATEPRLYVRWKTDRGVGTARVTGARLYPGHPLAAGATCMVCGNKIGMKIESRYVALGADDYPTRLKEAAGKSYISIAVLVHTPCIADVSEPKFEGLVIDTLKMIMGT
jgi:hypothetical protein